jgi:hypothetical protein
MKLSILFLVITFSFSSFANRSITFTEMMVKKNTKSELGVLYTGYLSKKAWCWQGGTAFEFGSFEAAEDMEKLENDLYLCKGKFVRQPYRSIMAFKIDKCSVIDLESLNKECENYKE